jgi:plasmid stability protein
MTSLTVRNLPEATHRALKLRAAQNGRSTEAEIRSILESAVRPQQGMGSALAAIGRDLGGVDIDFARDARPAAAASFE